MAGKNLNKFICFATKFALISAAALLLPLLHFRIMFAPLKKMFVNKVSEAQKWFLDLKTPLKPSQKNNQKVFVCVLNLLEEKDFWPWSGGTRSTILEFAARAQIANISK